MATIDQLINTERVISRLVKQTEFWVDREQTLAALRRADYLLSEVRQAGYFLTDPDCTPHLKQEALERLGQAIINCK